MSEQPLTIKDLAILLGQFVEEKKDSLTPQAIEFAEELKKFIIENDGNKNPHRYPGNPDLPEERE